MKVIGHRGAVGHAPENTLAAIERGIAAGADLVEVDLQRTADGHIVAMHDKRVDRVTNGSGYVTAMSLAELRRLRVGGDQPIPTLNEILECCRGRVGLMLELISEGIAESTVAAVREMRFELPLVYASFLHAEVRKAGIAAGDQGKALALFEGVPIDPARIVREAGATCAGASIESLTGALVECLHDAGLGLFVYVVNDPRDIEWVRSLDVDGIISDFPERVA